MKRNLLIVTLVAIFSMVYLGPTNTAGAFENNGCSLASVAGAFSFTYNGVGILPSGAVPVAAVGNFSTDAAGNFVGSEINSLAGTSAFQTILGKITVNHDCSGTLVAKVYEGGALVRTSFLHLQYDNNAAHIRIIFQKLVLPNGSNLPVVIAGDGQRLFHEHGE